MSHESTYQSQPVIAIPDIPEDWDSTSLVSLMLKISRDTDGEFYWFAREYSRIYRHHLEHSYHRLKLIRDGYTYAQNEFLQELHRSTELNSVPYSLARCDARITQIHWDFEAYLNSVSSALDVLARLAGICSRLDSPLSFGKLCKSKIDHELIEPFKQAKIIWVDSLKDYRDCFVHYTVSETMLLISCNRYKDGWQTRFRLPTNPNAREILSWKYSRKCHILAYSMTTFRHLKGLDSKVTNTIRKCAREGTYPGRFDNLFFKGQRDTG